MRGGEIRAIRDRHDSRGVHHTVRAVIVALDVVHVDRLHHARNARDIANETDESGGGGDQARVALEVRVVTL